MNNWSFLFDKYMIEYYRGSEFMKKAKILGIVFIAVIGALLIYKYCKPPATVKVNNNFSNEYNLIDENNVFVYKSIDDILITLDKGTGIIFLGFPQSSWCQSYVKYLNDVAIDKNIDIIYYYNFKSIRDNNTEKYKKLVSRLDDYLFLDDTDSYRLYAPTLVIVKEGKIIAFDNETSLMTSPILTSEYWTEEKINSFKEKIGNYFDEYLGSTNSSL